LSEFGVLGFELGYSLESPQSLVLWEAQFGDFANGAQVMIDQFVSSGEQKWMRQSGLVMLLPHGYDGAGPEHSSARLERFLGLCDSDPFVIPPKAEADRQQVQRANWQIVYCTTPANYFHALRRQIHRDFRKPMVVFMSKYLLRYQPSFSSIADFTKENGSRFLRLIPEATPEALQAPEKVKRIVFCSGQVYYNLLKARTENKIDDVALVRVEQLYPFPFDLVTEQVELYSNAELVWCQEEPQNMGAWSFVFRHIETAAKAAKKPRKHPTLPKYAGRPVSASPAVASVKLHTQQLDNLLNDALIVQ
jgi:2-oxoglutarate dehydrogenase E1 component